ncbi:RagB/SusD family nutrient uptake outer membrane protein [Salegentibacter sp. F188]|uniref:RagB/SusD family nutrient uptake outer membrane protein n=1 Tax=Autumnicola patrickiae TaxID=3075591 RepID=A0ABU3E0F1_9FLAO|nr:RagB/SusD family nutrient uptake outer membrane protein [Salegentibacter sp. F188]MDT0689432.1 RagB/SusD family nutrient uptake outer membrane protein [Salegentibacter sp. F188]
MKIRYYLGIAIASLAFTGCSEEFLETEPTEFVSSRQIADYSDKNPGLQAANISGIYALMYNTGTGGTDLDHDDFGQKSYDIYGDLLSADMVLAGLTYGWYSGISQMQSTIDYTDIDNYKPWRYYYRIVFSANLVIEQLGGNDAVPETEEGQYFMGQAKALRAYGYFYLAQYFSEEYNPSEPILPLYTTTDVAALPLSPTSEVYDVMVSDLQDAIELLDGFNRSAKQEVNKEVAQGLLAYVYAAMGNYEEVKTVTRDVIDNGGFSLMTAEEVSYMRHDGPDTDPYGGGFNDVNIPGWMWGVDITLDQGLDLVSWWGQVDLFSYSYAWAGDPKSIDANLYAAIPADDVRKAQFADARGNGILFPVNKFYDPARTIGAQRNITTDYLYMRVAEMYLLHAEAAAKTGDEATARETLKMLLDERVDDSSYVDDLSGADLEEEIYLQTRIELWGEGKSYLAMKRNMATITRGPNHLTNAGESIPYNADKLTLEIPLSEIQNNPSIN